MSHRVTNRLFARLISEIGARLGSFTPIPTSSTRLPTLYFIVALALFCCAIAHASNVVAYPQPDYATVSSGFTLTADGVSIPLVQLYNNKYSFGHLSFSGTTTFVVTLKSGRTITSFNISPHSLGISGTTNGATLSFSVKQRGSTYLIITATTNSGTSQPLVLAGDPPETDAPVLGSSGVYDILSSPYNADPTDNGSNNDIIERAITDANAAGGGVVYFRPGKYKIKNNIALKSNVTLYLAPGAVIHGSPYRSGYEWNAPDSNGNIKSGASNFTITGNVTNARITGRGIIDANSTALVTPGSNGRIDGDGYYRKGIIKSSADSSGNIPTNLTISGVTLEDSTTWSLDLEDANNLTVQNVKLLNDYNWLHSDGYDLVNVQNGLVDNCLGVTGDDVFDAKARKPTKNIVYSNSVAYTEHGTGTKVGVQSAGTASNIVFSNIQVVAGQRAVSISHDSGTASWNDIHFNDIRMENIYDTGGGGEYQAAPIVLWTYSSAGAGPVSNVSLSRVTIEPNSGLLSKISGTNSSGTVSDVTLQDVFIGGTLITNSNYQTYFNVGSNVSGLKFGLVSGGVYTLVNHHNALALYNQNATTCGNTAKQQPVQSPETDHQRWVLTSVSGNIYTVTSATSGCTLDSNGSTTSGSSVLINPPNGSNSQQWTITVPSPTNYQLVNAQSNLAVDINSVTVNSTNTQVVQAASTGSSNQEWKLTKQ